jgi:hypothetical protein
MDWSGRLWGARKWSVAGLAPFLSGDRLRIVTVAVVALGVALIGAVCWLTRTSKGEDVEIESPILSFRRRSRSGLNKAKDDAKTWPPTQTKWFGS